MTRRHTLDSVRHSNDAVDFIADLAAFLRDELTNRGYLIETSATNGQVIDQFVRLRHRWVVAKPRTAHLAANLKVPLEVRVGFDALIAAVENGDNLLPYQSTSMLKPGFDDGMLNDWGIQHFHAGLGLHPTTPGFNARFGPIVYAVVTDNDAYVVTIDQHQRWTLRSLLETIHVNWPRLIAHCRVEGQLSHHLTEVEHKQPRSANINSALSMLDGTNYMSPGGGATTNGMSVMARLDAIALTSAIRDKERAWRNEQGATAPARLACSWHEGKLRHQIQSISS